MKWGEDAIKILRDEASNFSGDKEELGKILKEKYFKDMDVTANAISIKVGKLEREGRLKFKESNFQNDLQKIVLDYLNKNKRASIGDISRFIDKSELTVGNILKELSNLGYDISYNTATKKVECDSEKQNKLKPFPLSNLTGDVIKFGVVSDVHFGSIEQQLSLLNLAYSKFEEEGCKFVLNAGDLFDGDGRVYRGQSSYQFLHGADPQLEYAIGNYPKASFKTHVISGNHCLSFKKSTNYNITRRFCENRKDVVYCGDIRGEFIFKNKYKIVLVHGSGGISYSRSYRPQKFGESLISEVISTAQTESYLDIPSLIILGHWHVAGWFPYSGTQLLLAGTLQAQTEYLKAKALMPDIGVYIVTMEFKKDKLIKINPQWFSLGHLVRGNDY